LCFRHPSLRRRHALELAALKALGGFGMIAAQAADAVGG
jgi:hypothetical protein